MGLVCESLNEFEFQRGKGSIHKRLSVGSLATAKKWLDANQKFIKQYPKDYWNYTYEETKDKKIKIKPKHGANTLTNLDIPPEVAEVFEDRMKFNLGTVYNADRKGYVRLAIEALENGYLPPPSKLTGDFYHIRKALGKDVSLEIVKKVFKDELPSNFVEQIQHWYKPDLLAKFFKNPELRTQTKLEDRSEEEVKENRIKALLLFKNAGNYKDVTSPLQRKRHSISIQNLNNRRVWTLTTGGRIRMKGARSGAYANDKATFQDMAEWVINKDKQPIRTRKRTNQW